MRTDAGTPRAPRPWLRIIGVSLLAAAAAGAPSPAPAQQMPPPGTLWESTIPDREYSSCEDAIETRDGGVVVLCQIPWTDRREWGLDRFDGTGDLLWRRELPEMGCITGRLLELGGGDLVLFAFEYICDSGNGTLRILRFDAAGTLRGESMYEGLYPFDVWEDGEGFTILTDNVKGGYYSSNCPGTVQFGRDGTLLSPLPILCDGTFEYTLRLRRAGDGGLILGGLTREGGKFIVRFDGALQETWRATRASWSWLDSIHVTPDGGCLLAWDPSPEAEPPGLSRLDGSGTVLWERDLGPWRLEQITGSGDARDGGCFLAGPVTRNGHTSQVLFRVDGDGVLRWRKELPHGLTWTSIARICQTSDGGLLVAGTCGGDWFMGETPVAKGFLLRLSPDVPVPDREFLRGDTDGNGALELADALRILEGLFLSQGDLPCLDAADINDDGTLNISDPITLLRFLFLGGDPPPAPFPAAGTDPTPDDTGCLG